jgi:hypothetical protein
MHLCLARRTLHPLGPVFQGARQACPGFLWENLEKRNRTKIRIWGLAGADSPAEDRTKKADSRFVAGVDLSANLFPLLADLHIDLSLPN